MKKNKIKKWILYAVAWMLLLASPAGINDCREVQAAATVGTPKLVSAKASGTSGITLSWKKVSGASGYRIYRKTDGKKWETVKTFSGSSTVSFKDTGLKPGIRYIYTVRAYKRANGKSTWGRYDTKGIFAVTAMDAPKFRVAASEKEDCAAVITITPSQGSAGSVIFRKAGSDKKWTRIAVTGAKSYTDRTVKKGVTYTYTVRGYRRYSGVTYYSKYNTSGLKVRIEPDSAAFVKLKNYITRNGYTDDKGNKYIADGTEEQGQEFVWSIAYLKSKNAFEFALESQGNGYYDGVYMVLKSNAVRTDVEYGLVTDDQQNGFYAAGFLWNEKYGGIEELIFNVKENEGGFDKGEIEDMANMVLRAGFEGWQEILTQSAKVSLQDLGFKSICY